MCKVGMGRPPSAHSECGEESLEWREWTPLWSGEFVGEGFCGELCVW